MYVKVHEQDKRIVVAICDEEIIGKTFSEEDRELNITERFYKGEKKSEEEVLKIIEKSDNLNLVGEKTIKIALDNNLITRESVIKIDNIPHTQIFAL
jgi:hypothetical protein